jgi:type III pantothenate kinase
MFIAIDIGNTNLVVGVFSDGKITKKWRLATRRDTTRDEYSILLRTMLRDEGIEPKTISTGAVCSVVPILTPKIDSILRSSFGFEPLVVKPGIKTGLVILYEPPQDVGADRIVNSVAGYKLFGGPLIIVDFGTATTFDIVSSKGEYIGGVITPGPAVSAEALSLRTAKLPRIDLEKPKSVIGHNTIDAMRAGLYYGHPGSCDRIIEKIFDELGEKPNVIATGGLADAVASESVYISKILPDLTLEGLRFIYDMNK